MIIKGKNLINLRVETESGDYLGKVYDFLIDTETYEILKYYIKGGSFLNKVFPKELIIDRLQIVAITKEKMIVNDLDIKNLEEVKGLEPIT